VTPREAWHLLDLPTDSDAGAVRRAYADRLRAMDPDADPAGFARLRAARDTALAALRAVAEPADDSRADISAEEPAKIRDWAYAAPRLDLPAGDVRGTGATARIAHPAATPALTRGPPLIFASAPFAIPVLNHDSHGDVLSDRNRAAALRQMLTAGAPNAPLSPAEATRAGNHLSVLLRQSASMTIEQVRALEDWIADLLARTWPRCAPLLEPAFAAFDWAAEDGHIRERAAVAFLNARLRGLHFVEQVTRPDHRYHRIWAELSKPGTGRGWRVRREEVRAMLDGIRKHFPEVEHHLDAERVAAWDRRLSARSRITVRIGHVRFGLRKAWLLAWLILLALRLLANVLNG
jgi:hypothetical protein